MLKFSNLCDLLENLANISHHDPPYNSREISERSTAVFNSWFKSYRRAIDSLDAVEAAAFLSTLLPRRRKDRVYGLQTTSLLKVLCRCLGLNASRRNDLSRFKVQGNGDLGDCLERVFRGGGPPALPPVTVLEIDDFMHLLAGQSLFSAAEVQQAPLSREDRDESLRYLLLRMTPVEAKWITRLILKDLSPAMLDESLVQKLYHFLLDDLLSMHNSFEAATKVLKETFKGYPSQPDPQSRVILRQTAAASMRPVPGIMIARSDFCKARSLKQCLQMTAGRRWLVDRKYDGEYCQIHVDLNKGDQWLKIFSKSGRDSTQDRKGLHDTLRKCLRIGSDKCQIKSQCVLVGEMVVFDAADNCIVSFDKIRKHVSRGGVFLGTDNDSPVNPAEHLMIVFFDLLLWDDENMINLPIEQRRLRLSKVYKKLDGHAQTAESTVIDFGKPGSERKLMHQFAASNVLRHEGLVLKPCNVPYLSFASSAPATTSYCPKSIKLKKDYISGLGDEADFAVIGASYSAQEANKRPGYKITWTHFHLGCLMNEADVDQHKANPVFKYVGTIAMDQCIPVPVLQQINAEGKFFAESPATAFSVKADANFRPDVYFRRPFVFEVLGSSYSRPSNSGFYMLRHPRVKKMHSDRTWRECITFDQLQDAAQDALAAPAASESQANLAWIERLERTCKVKFAQMSYNTTPASARSVPTPRSERSLRKSKEMERAGLQVDEVRSSPLARYASRPLQIAGLLTGTDDGAPFLPTPPTSSPFKETAMHHRTSSRKRKAGTDDVDARKRQRGGKDKLANEPTIRALQPLTHATNRASRDLASIGSQASSLGSENVLPDIASGNSPPTSSTGLKSTDTVRKGTKAISPREIEQTQLSARLDDRAPTSDTGIAALFDKTVVYIDPTLTTSVTRLLRRLRASNVTVIENIQDWDRDSFVHIPLTSTVGESQAYPGLRKVVLVDAEHAGRLCAAVAKVARLNGGMLREDIDIWDWRIVDGLLEAREMEKTCDRGEKRCIIGRVRFDEEAGCAIFVPQDVGSSAETT